MSALKPSGNSMMRMFTATFCLFLMAGGFSAAFAAKPADDLAGGFAVPPDSARPHTWWHWMNGNITKEGITADLEAMKRVGIGGAQIFNVSERIPEGPVDIMSPQWLELIRHAAAEADRLGMELCFHNCPGWANSGGPWIRPEHGMQTVVTSKTQAKGPTHFDAVLSQPPTKADYYRDIAVLAFPTPSEKVLIDKPNPKILAGAEYKYGLQPDPKTIPAAAVVERDRIVDLTSSMAADGKFAWDVPAGNWTILRIGHTPTGRTNHPAPKSGTGLECDKLSREALDAHWAGGVDPWPANR
jgi:(4-O-methyl)-D-glucuronate---lignin esterase